MQASARSSRLSVLVKSLHHPDSESESSEARLPEERGIING